MRQQVERISPAATMRVLRASPKDALPKSLFRARLLKKAVFWPLLLVTAQIVSVLASSQTAAAHSRASRLTFAVPQTVLPPGADTLSFDTPLTRHVIGSGLRSGLTVQIALPQTPASSGPTAAPQANPERSPRRTQPGLLQAGHLQAGRLTIRFLPWDGLTQSLEQAVGRPVPPWQAVMANGLQASLGCAAGWLQPDWRQPASSDTFFSNAISTASAAKNAGNGGKCGLPAGALALSLSWDKSRLPLAPNWADLWDVVRLPGQRGLPQSARGALEVALLADGVPPGKIYASLETQAGADRAFRRLDQLRPYIAWWRTPEEARTLMRRSAVLMALVPRTSLPPAPRQLAKKPLKKNQNADAFLASGFSASAEDTLYAQQFWVLPAHSADAQNGLTQTALTQLAPHLPALPTTLPNGSLVIDDGFWTAHGGDLENRFQAWLSRSGFGRQSPR